MRIESASALLSPVSLGTLRRRMARKRALSARRARLADIVVGAEFKAENAAS